VVTVLTGDLTLQWYDAAVQSGIVGVDIETSGLDKLKDKIACIQLSIVNYGNVIVRFPNVYPTHLLALLENAKIKKIFHLATFDLNFLMRDYNTIWPQNIADTIIAAKLLDPKKQLFVHPITGRPSHSLAALVWHYKEVILNKELAVSNWFTKKLTKKQLDYAVQDVVYLPYILEQLEKSLPPYKQMLAHEAFNNLPAYVALEQIGIKNIYGY